MTAAEQYVDRVVQRIPADLPLRQQVAMELGGLIAERLERAVDPMVEIGSDPACGMVLHDPKVSRRHLRVHARGRATHVIRVDHPVAPAEPVIGFGSFASMRVLLTSTEPSDSPPAFAMLSVPSAVAPSTAPSAPAVAVGS